MFFVVDKPRLQRIIAIVREDRKRRKGEEIPFLRLKADGEELTVSGGGCVTATFPATVYQPGVLFVSTTGFRKVLKATETGEKFIALQVSDEGLRLGDVLLPFEGSNMVLYKNPAEAPDKWPPPPPAAEQIPKTELPTLFDVERAAEKRTDHATSEQTFQLRALSKEVYSQLFNIYINNPERVWVKKWWRRLARAKLTSYSSAREYNDVLARLVTLAYLYHRWAECAYREECGIEEQMGEWYDLLPWNRDKDLGGLPEIWFVADSHDGFHKAGCIYSVISQEFDRVVTRIAPNYKKYGVFGLAQEMRMACGRGSFEAGFPVDDVSFGDMQFAKESLEVAKELWEETGLMPRELDAIIILQELQ